MINIVISLLGQLSLLFWASFSQAAERAERYEATIEELTARIKNVSTSVCNLCWFIIFLFVF